MILQKIWYRSRYWYRKVFVNLTGLCPDCRNNLNFNGYGQAFCPWCGGKKG